MDNLFGLDNAALWALAVGFFSPPVIAVIQQAHWTPRRRSLAAFAFYLVVAAGTVFFSGALNGTGDFLRVALIIFVMASVSYQHLWRPTGVTPAIESATSKSAPEPARVPEHRASSTPESQPAPAADPAAPRPPAIE